MPAVSRLHTLVYPTHSAAARANLEFAAKAVGDVRFYALDFAQFVADAATAIGHVFVQADGGLAADNIAWSASVVWLHLGGGSLSVPLPRLTVSLVLANGDVEVVVVTQPIVASPASLAGAVAVGWRPVTFGPQPVDVTQLDPLPGGFTDVDQVVAYRPPATPGGTGRLGLSPVGAVVGSAAGVTAFLRSLPSTEPDEPGAFWWNGPFLARTPGFPVAALLADDAGVIAEFLLSLPSVEPTESGKWWWNGPFLSRT